MLIYLNNYSNLWFIFLFTVGGLPGIVFSIFAGWYPKFLGQIHF